MPAKLYIRTSLQRTLLLFMVMISVCCHSGAQQTSSVYNRFQYHNYIWQVFHTDAFHIYFPRGYDSLCSFTARELPGIMVLLKQRMFTEPDKALHIILYPSTDQLYETNIGSGEGRNYTMPTVVLKGNRIVAAYDGSYEHLKQQLAEALTRSIWEEQFDKGIGDQLKTALTDDKIPLWCREGMISYFANGWAIEQEDLLKRTFTENNFSSWHEVLSYQPRLSGIAFCYYLTRNYYPQAVSQLYQQLKKKRDLNRAIRLVTKKNLQQTLEACFAFYRERFRIENNKNKEEAVNEQVTALSIKNKALITIKHSKGIVKAMEVNSDGTYIAYTIHYNRQRSVYVSDVQTKKAVKLKSYKLPPWYDDLSKDIYPLIKWTEDKNDLSVIYPEKGRIVLRTFSTTGNELAERTLKHIDGIKDLNGYDDNSRLLAAYRKGQTDIIIYDPHKEKYKAVTNDEDDDSEPVLDKTMGNVLFSSIRRLKKNNYDPSVDKDSLYRVQGIFNSDHLKQPIVSDTLRYVHWRKPVMLNNGNLLVTHTLHGSVQFALITPTGSVTSLTDYHPYSYSSKTNRLHFYKSSLDSIYITTADANGWITNERTKASDAISPWLKDYLADADKRAKEDSILKAARANNEPGFLEGVLKPRNSKELAQQRKDSIYRSLQYDAERIEPYVLQLHSAYFTARVNNDYFINKYQPYHNYQGQFKFPEVGGMVQGGFTDLLENHHFNMGYRLPAGTEGSDFFVFYQNTKKSTDWGINYFRKVESLQPDPKRDWKDENGNTYPNLAKVKTHYYELSFHHPLSYYTSIDFTTAIRKDRTIFLATEKYSLNFAPLKSLWSINTLSYTYNKLLPTLPMLCKGFSGKVMLDVFAGLQGLANDAVYGASIDLQYHQPVYKYITAVAGLKAGHSGGQQKILYNMGGVDNNLTVRTDTTVHFNQTAPYAFQSLITPLRGFQQNSLYGNQYALLNMDVYFPVFQSLAPIETNFSSVNNLQLGLFSDVAYAKETWQLSPAGRSEVSYGFSIRTVLAGYLIRGDIALPNETRKKVLWYLSIAGW